MAVDTQSIIDSFELYVDDGTELSSAEELSLANRIYRKVLNDRTWSFLKKSYTGTVSGDYVALPSDFKYIISNYDWTDNSMETGFISAPVVVFVGSTYEPYRVVNWSDRRQYRTQSNICFIDARQGRLYFTVPPANGTSIEFDYVYRPDDLTLSTRPVWDSDFDSIITHGMATDDYIIQQFDKARSYAQENTLKYQQYLRDMQYQDSQFNLN
jgi:hypothetical protein